MDEREGWISKFLTLMSLPIQREQTARKEEKEISVSMWSIRL